jgi:hypothetical protein
VASVLAAPAVLVDLTASADRVLAVPVDLVVLADLEDLEGLAARAGPDVEDQRALAPEALADRRWAYLLGPR